MDPTICGALRNLVTCAQFKKREKHPWRSVTFRLQPATLLKVTLLRGFSSRFLNCTNGTKSRKAPNICGSFLTMEPLICVFKLILHIKSPDNSIFFQQKQTYHFEVCIVDHFVQ